MEIRMVDTFLKIAQLHSFSKAANELGYAQSTVTTQIQLLEAELDTLLFERIGNRVELTAAGQRFVDYAYELSNLFHSAKDIIQEGNEVSGSLRIGAVDSIATSVLPGIIKEYVTSYPKVELTIETDSSEELERMLRNGSLDLGIFLSLDSKTSSTLYYQTYEDSLVGLSGKHNSLSKQHDILFTQLESQTFLLTEKECQYHRTIMQLCKRYHIEPKILLESGNTEILKRFVEQNIGITFLPAITVEKELKAKQLYQLDLNHNLPKVLIQIAYHNKKYKTNAMKEFLRHFDVVMKKQNS